MSLVSSAITSNSLEKIGAFATFDNNLIKNDPDFVSFFKTRSRFKQCILSNPECKIQANKALEKMDGVPEKVKTFVAGKITSYGRKANENQRQFLNEETKLKISRLVKKLAEKSEPVLETENFVTHKTLRVDCKQGIKSILEETALTTGKSVKDEEVFNLATDQIKNYLTRLNLSEKTTNFVLYKVGYVQAYEC